MSERRVRVGVSACIFHPDKTRTTFNGRALYYVERSMAHLFGSLGALLYLIPEPEPGSRVSVDAIADDLDGLVLAGGVDVSPTSYGEEARRPEWAGDRLRDDYEIALLRAVVAKRKPVLGICRGHQVLNVAYGGSLHQDISDEVPGALIHRDADRYEQNRHEIAIDPESSLARLYPGVARAWINSVHHQAVKRPAQGALIEACSTADGVVEALRIQGDSYVRGVQWHPEFDYPHDPALLDSAPLLNEFLDEARARREERV